MRDQKETKFYNKILSGKSYVVELQIWSIFSTLLSYWVLCGY